MSVCHNENYIQYFVQGDELDYEFINHSKPTDTGCFVEKSYDDGESFVDLNTAEANLILAIDAVKSANSSDRINFLVNIVRMRIAKCKFYLPIKKRRQFFDAAWEAKKPFYYKEQANEILLKLDQGYKPSKLKQEIYDLKIPFPLKKDLWLECDKQIAKDKHIDALRKIISK